MTPRIDRGLPRQALPTGVAGVNEHADIATLSQARARLQGCRRCPLYANSTQAVRGMIGDEAHPAFIEQDGRATQLSYPSALSEHALRSRGAQRHEVRADALDLEI